jgi:hypothetical protein
MVALSLNQLRQPEVGPEALWRVIMKQSARRIPTITIVLGIALAAMSCGDKPEPKAAEGNAIRAAAQADPAPCVASSAWVSAPAPPQEIGGNGVAVSDETNCQFHQFAWQWFLSVTQPSAPGSDERVFETFNVVGAGGKTHCFANGPAPKGKAAIQRSLFVRTLKPQSGDFQPVLPQNIKQAGSRGVLYDQKGNVVLYAMLYNSTECKGTTTQGFLPGTIEIKTSWRILPAVDPSYYTMTATIQPPSAPAQTFTLGLVGFHLVINTTNHPEFVWATFEHASNGPNCTNPQATPPLGWTFTSAPAAACLAANGFSGCSQFRFNTAAKAGALTGTPNEVCRAFSDGTDPGPKTNGNNNDTNRFNVDTLNAQIVGANGFVTALPSSNPMAVWKNYSLQGALWTNGGVASGGTDAQRGSRELVNTTMETFNQDPATGNKNCFGCHHFDPTTLAGTGISHIFTTPSGKKAAK